MTTSQKMISMTTEPKVYDSWSRIPSHLAARGQWRGLGKGIKAREKPKAFVQIEESLRESRYRDSERVGLYDESQTYVFTEPKRSKWLLIEKFVARNEMFGLRRVGDEIPYQWPSQFLYGSVGELVYKSFNYKNRIKGVRTGLRYEGKAVYADALYVLAPKLTNWFVLDLDNHEPTNASTKAHLLLVDHLVKNMPQIAKQIGATSVFYDYRQDNPQGIHIWFTLARQSLVKPLHTNIRRVLGGFADPTLDHLLKTNHLKPMDSLEILPTEGQLIRMFGTYDRRVFTTEELQPNKQELDAEALLAHIRSNNISGDPRVRYARLAIAGLRNGLQEAPPSISVPPVVQILLSNKPTQGSGYFSRLVDACLNGVTEKDVLFECYLSPIAQALYWRDFVGQPDRAKLVKDALGLWIDRKHNRLVTRINKGRRKELDSVIRHVIKRLPSTPAGIRAFWEKVVANDKAYSRQKVSLVACINAEVPVVPVTVNKQTLKALPSLLSTGGGMITKGNTYNVKDISCVSPLSSASSLPPALEASLRAHLRKAGKRKGKFHDRVVTFALHLLSEIGLRATRTIDGKRMNQLAGLGRGQKHILQYKRLLVGAGIIEPGWEKTYSKAEKRAARYTLTQWARAELEKNWAKG